MTRYALTDVNDKAPPTVVADCPRCGANQMTFEVLADVFTGTSYEWQSHHELAVRCRRCIRLSVLLVSLRDVGRKGAFTSHQTVVQIDGDIQPTFSVIRFLAVADLMGAAEPPEFLPADVEAAFREGARCMTIGCHNAAAAMFRLSLDLATKPLLPDPAVSNIAQPNKRQRYNLADRLDWLIEQGAIASSLASLAHNVRQDGNDGAHDGSLAEVDAADLLDFATALFERQYTEPERLQLAERRRDERRAALRAARPDAAQPQG
ncbi:uncharacterized protein DUF4145 [Sphingomonas sp. F9_3S_D5_B_2]